MVSRMPTGSVEHLIAEPKLLALHVDRFLLAAVGAVADQAFANDMCGDVDSVIAGGEGLEVFGDRRLRGIASLKIEAAERNDRQDAEGEGNLRRSAQEEIVPATRCQESDQPDREENARNSWRR